MGDGELVAFAGPDRGDFGDIDVRGDFGNDPTCGDFGDSDDLGDFGAGGDREEKGDSCRNDSRGGSAASRDKEAGERDCWEYCCVGGVRCREVGVEPGDLLDSVFGEVYEDSSIASPLLRMGVWIEASE